MRPAFAATFRQTADCFDLGLIRRLDCNAGALAETVVLNSSEDESYEWTTFERCSSRRSDVPPRGPSRDRNRPTGWLRTAGTGSQSTTPAVRPNTAG